jgi:hypothetical protein
MKELLAQFFDKRTAFTATAVCASCVALFMILGILGHNSYTPLIVEKYFGISDDIERQTAAIAENVQAILLPKLTSATPPAGYSRTFSYDESAPASQLVQTLIFYARSQQHIMIHVTSSGYFIDHRAGVNARQGKFVMLIDGKEWPGAHRTLNESFALPLTEDQLPKETDSGMSNTHTIQLYPAPENRYKERSSFDCLVLVQNNDFTP